MGKAQRPNKTFIQSPLRYGISKAHYDVASPKPATMQHLQNPVRYDNIFTKSYKTQMSIWHLFYKAQTLLFGTYFTKPKY